MALTTLAGVIAGLQRPTNTMVGAGSGVAPNGAWVYTPRYFGSGETPAQVALAVDAAGAAMTYPAYSACIPYPPAQGANSAYIAHVDNMVGASSNQCSNVTLIDRLWENANLSMTLTTAQTVNSVAWPARDVNGSTDGEGVYIAIELSATAGAGTPTITMSYTNSAGVAGRTGSLIASVPASCIQGSWHVFGLDAGDTGVRSVQSITMSATRTSGSMRLVAFRPIVMLSSYDERSGMPCTNSSSRMREDAVSLGLPKLHAGTVLEAVHSRNGNITSGGALFVTVAHG